jgi:peptidoglycan/xylan/chitin deacetylase (PgdA/CDA1 family)
MMLRRELKSLLAHGAVRRAPAQGATMLIYHRVGGGSPDERDLTVDDFEAQLTVLAEHDVLSLDAAVDRIERRDDSPSVVLTFDDGFHDLYANAWPMMRARRLPFTVYLATAYVGGTMHWDGSTARAAGPALTWGQLEEMVASGLCTLGNHTHTHARPELVDDNELDTCSDEVERRLGVRPRHFAYTWGVPVPALEDSLRQRFRTAATGRLGRNAPGQDLHRLTRVPVRGSDPLAFFTAKLHGRLGPERCYQAIVSTAKLAGARA